VLGADKPRDDAVEYLRYFHLGFRRFLTVLCVLACTGRRNGAGANILFYPVGCACAKKHNGQAESKGKT